MNNTCEHCYLHYNLTPEECQAINEGRFEDVRGFGCESIDKYGYCTVVMDKEYEW